MASTTSSALSMPARSTVSLGALTVTSATAAAATTTTSTTADNSRKVIIIWQKSTISEACKKLLATIDDGVHVWDPVIDAKLDGPGFAAASYQCLILWAGDPGSNTAAQDVHTWIASNRKYIKETGIKCYVIPTKFFSLAGIESVYCDFATAIKALPKWNPDLHQQLLNFEAKFPESEVSIVRGLVQKLIKLVTKKE